MLDEATVGGKGAAKARGQQRQKVLEGVDSASKCCWNRIGAAGCLGLWFAPANAHAGTLVPIPVTG